MKAVNRPFIIISFFFIGLSCEGPTGPVGPQGPPGPAGVDGQPGEIGFVMEWDGVDFTATNDYAPLLDFNDFNFTALESDVSLAFLLDNDATLESGQDVWIPLPQLYILGEDLIQYSYDFTKFDISIFLEANFSLDLLNAEFTDSKVVRVVVVPGEFVAGRKSGSEISYRELEEKLELPQLKKRELPRVN